MCSMQVKGSNSIFTIHGLLIHIVTQENPWPIVLFKTGVVNITIFTCGSSASHPYGFWGQKVDNSRHQKKLCAQNLKNLHDNLLNWSSIGKWRVGFKLLSPQNWHFVYCLINLKSEQCLFVWSFSSHSRIFNSFGDVTFAGEGLLILTDARYLRPLSSEGSLGCHIYCDTGHLLIMVIFEDSWHSHILLSVW